MLKNYLYRIQSSILTNYGNTSYQIISNDVYFENIPTELYEIWYSPNNFSFREFEDIKTISYLKGKVLLIYYFNIFIIFIKLKIIFIKMKGGISNG